MINAAQDAEILLLRAALDYAKREIKILVETGCDKIEEAGGDVDPPERTYGPIIDRIDAMMKAAGAEAPKPAAFNDNMREG